MNELIMQVANAGLSDKITNLFIVLSFVPVIILCCNFGNKIASGALKSIVLVAFVYVANYFLMLVLTWIELGFRFFGAQNGIRSFVYTPLICLLGAKILRMEWGKANAIWAICLPFSHAVAHLGCVFSGCCEGYPCSWGIYNPVWDEYLFPIQIVESAVAFAVGLCVVYRINKRHFAIDGKEYPIMLILFGSTRFVCEFFRADAKLLLGCSSLSFHALFMCLVGAVWLAIIRKKEKQHHEADN